MTQHQSKDLTPATQSDRAKATQSAPGRTSHPAWKPARDWEQPDFEELDLCMEVTTYIYHWQ